eukprot:188453-Chlamydomonas_euryale.AAC.5
MHKTALKEACKQTRSERHADNRARRGVLYRRNNEAARRQTGEGVCRRAHAHACASPWNVTALRRLVAAA